MAWYGGGFEFPEYVSVADAPCSRPRGRREDRAQAETQPRARTVRSRATKLVRTFWGKAWCDNLESYRDYENRLPRGRSYVRHGAVIDLQIARRQGHRPCERDSTLRGRRDDPVAAAEELEQARVRVHQADRLVGRSTARTATDAGHGARHAASRAACFPSPNEISFECSCPDWAGMCKHVAAALYGVGVRLEEKPELFFELRGVDHAELVGGAAEAVPRLADGAKSRKVVKGADLSALFGIELESSTTKVATAGTDGAGDRSAPEPRSRRRDERSPRKEPTQPRRRTRLLLKARGTRRAQKRSRNPNSR